MAAYTSGGPVKEGQSISDSAAAKASESISAHWQVDESSEYEPLLSASSRARGPSIWKWWDADMGTFGHGGPIKEALVEDLEGLIQSLNQRQFASGKPPRFAGGLIQEGQSISDAVGALPSRAAGLQHRSSPQPAIPTGTRQQMLAPKVVATDMTIREMDALAIEAALRRLRASLSGHSTLQH